MHRLVTPAQLALHARDTTCGTANTTQQVKRHWQRRRRNADGSPTAHPATCTIAIKPHLSHAKPRYSKRLKNETDARGKMRQSACDKLLETRPWPLPADTLDNPKPTERNHALTYPQHVHETAEDVSDGLGPSPQSDDCESSPQSDGFESSPHSDDFDSSPKRKLVLGTAIHPNTSSGPRGTGSTPLGLLSTAKSSTGH